MAGSGPVARKTALNSLSYRAVLRGWAFRPQPDGQLGELVQVTGADVLPMEALAGALLAAVEQSKKSPEAMQRWAERGQAVFQQEGKRGKKTAPGDLTAGPTSSNGAA